MATIAQVLDAFLGVDQTGRRLPQATRSGNFAAGVHHTHLVGLWLAGRLIVVRFEQYVVAYRDRSSAARISDLQTRIAGLQQHTPHRFAFMRSYARVPELLVPTQVIAMHADLEPPTYEEDSASEQELAR